MAGHEEEVCPLCREKMDLTDQELQPCMCGYEVCLWCWHSIVQATIKDGSDARCPACRNPYDKDIVLKRTISKERLAILNANKKEKLQKTKQRVPDSGKDLNTVRVIQRNIVYMAGISISLANDKTLRKKEYLGQYGRIVKIVIAQTDGSRQYYSSNTCIVYITFSKGEEAIRCIQAVNGYILDGRPLKACFGTTRYCHSWLKNQSCNNRDCLYVHHFVPQEDICTREEVVPFCTSKLQQCSGLAFNNLKQRSGSFLPPPLGSKSLLPPLGLINNNMNVQSDEFGRSYASVAASHTQSKLSSMTSCLIMPSSGTEVHLLANACYDDQISNAICTSKNGGPLSKDDVDNFSHVRPFAEINYPVQNSRRDYNTTKTNMMTKDGENIANEFSSLQDDSVTVSSNYDFSNVQELSGDSPWSLHNILPLYDWFRLHSDLESQKLSCSFVSEGLSSLNNRESKCFSTLPTITSTLCHKLDKSSLHFPAKPMLCNLKHKKLCGNSSSYNGLDFELSQSYTIRGQRLLQMGAIKDTCFPDRSNVDFHGSSILTSTMHVDQCKDRILSDIFALDLDEIDDPADSHCVEQFCDFDDLSIISKPQLPSTRGQSKSSFSMMDGNYAARGDFSLWPISTSSLNKNSPQPCIMVKHKAYMEESSNAFNSSSILSTVEAASTSENSLFMHHSGSPLSQAVPQCPNSRSSQRTTLSTPPGFPPKKSDQGAGSKYLPSNLFSGGYSYNIKERCDSHANPRLSYSAIIGSTAKDILRSSSAVSLHSCESSSLAGFNSSEDGMQGLSGLKGLPQSWTISVDSSRVNSSEHFSGPHISKHYGPLEESNLLSSNVIDCGIVGRNQTGLTAITSAIPDLQDGFHASYL